MKDQEVDVEKFLFTKTIVIFDGVCNVCNGSVDFLLRHDSHNQLMFGSFQQQNVAELLRGFGVDTEPTTMYVLQRGLLFFESTAVLKIVRVLPYPWKLFYSAIIIPPFVRNSLYRFIARNRYRWFGKRDSCRLASAEEREKFL
ncbi:MAG: DUF393 domain-containing protein [Ignavibacteria bacterium]|nr:DUF393 domain-containing protein [Ignavibacteria bacterium]